MIKIEKFLNISIRPVLQSHGGDLEIVSYDEIKQDLQLRVIGQCCSCPHSIDTIENFIKAQLFKKFPNLKNISVNAGVSDDLLNIAVKLLKKEA